MLLRGLHQILLVLTHDALFLRNEARCVGGGALAVLTHDEHPIIRLQSALLDQSLASLDFTDQLLGEVVVMTQVSVRDL